MHAPTVSVVMGTYNHAPFVAESIRSVLAQDFSDFEFLISDDGSADDTGRIVAEQDDPRISFQPNTVNRGAALVFNELIRRARGRFIAVINSDDAWLPGKLSAQVDMLEKNPALGAVFGRAEFVDREGHPIDKNSLSFGTVFDQPNRSRGEWLQQFFWRGNCLCHPSVLIRRDLYQQIGLYDNRLRQLPDLDMWVRLVKVADLHVFDRTMVRFRILPGENASSDTYTNRVRTLNEHLFIALTFFDNVSATVFIEGFQAYVRQPTLPPELTLEIEKAFLFLNPVTSLDHVYKLVALLKLRDLLAHETYRPLLKQYYHFDDRSLQALAAEADGLQRNPALASCPPAVSEVHVDNPLVRPVREVPTRELGAVILRRLMIRLSMLCRV